MLPSSIVLPSSYNLVITDTLYHNPCFTKRLLWRCMHLAKHQLIHFWSKATVLQHLYRPNGPHTLLWHLQLVFSVLYCKTKDLVNDTFHIYRLVNLMDSNYWFKEWIAGSNANDCTLLKLVQWIQKIPLHRTDKAWLATNVPILAYLRPQKGKSLILMTW